MRIRLVIRIPTVKLKIPGKLFLKSNPELLFGAFQKSFFGIFNFTVGILLVILRSVPCEYELWVRAEVFWRPRYILEYYFDVSSYPTFEIVRNK